MKVTIDLDQLLEEGKITQAEHDKFSQFSAGGTAALAFNILVASGVIAVNAAALALLPTHNTAIVLGLVVCATGIALIYRRYEHWLLLANICVLVGALLLGGGVINAGGESVDSYLLVAAVFAGVGIFVRSSLLTVLAVLALAGSIWMGHFYAPYFVMLFVALSIALYQLAKRLGAVYQAIAINAARTSALLVNAGFWIGSISIMHNQVGAIAIPAKVFSGLWAITLILASVWAWRHNHRWLLNVAAVFGCIDFYTQWLIWLGTSAETVLAAGVLTIGFAIGLRTLNAKMG